MYPVCDLMKTSEPSVECENVNGDPLVVTELNAVEEPSSSVSNVSEATIPVIPAMHAVARTGVCPNFSPGDPVIIIGEKSEENSGEEYPVTSSTVAGEPVCWERSTLDETVATNASDSGLEIRTEHWEKNSNENSSLCVKTSWGQVNDCCATASCTISEDSWMLPLGPAIVREQSIVHGGIADKAGCFEKQSPTESPVVTANGDGCVTLEDEQCNVKCEDKCKIFGWLSESTSIAEEPEESQSSYQCPEVSQVSSFDPSSAAEAQGLRMELEKMGLETEDIDLSSSVRDEAEDKVGDGARHDQPALTATMTPQPIINREISEKKYQEFADTQHGNKENYESFVLPNRGAEFEKKHQEFRDTQPGNKENYGSFVLPNRGAELMENNQDFEESRVEDRSNVRSGDNSDAKRNVKNCTSQDVSMSEDIGGKTCEDREEILYNPVETLPSQGEFSSSTESRRPTRSMVRPSRFRDAAFETQFQPGRKKIRKLCFRPGRGAFCGCSSVDRVCDLSRRYCYRGWCLRSGRGDQILINKGNSKQTGYSRSSLVWYCNGRRPVLNRRCELSCRWPTRFKFRLKKYRWRRKENSGTSNIENIRLTEIFRCQYRNRTSVTTSIELDDNYYCQCRSLSWIATLGTLMYEFYELTLHLEEVLRWTVTSIPMSNFYIVNGERSVLFRYAFCDQKCRMRTTMVVNGRNEVIFCALWIISKESATMKNNFRHLAIFPIIA